MSFISEIVPHAQRIHREYNILASIVIAQAIHESNWGKSGLATKGKNLFGIKGTYNGQSVTMRTWEVYNGKSVYVDAAFMKYPSWYGSLQDLANLYRNGVFMGPRQVPCCHWGEGLQKGSQGNSSGRLCH